MTKFNKGDKVRVEFVGTYERESVLGGSIVRAPGEGVVSVPAGTLTMVKPALPAEPYYGQIVYVGFGGEAEPGRYVRVANGFRAILLGTERLGALKDWRTLAGTGANVMYARFEDANPNEDKAVASR